MLDTVPRDQAAGLRSTSPAQKCWSLAITSGKGGVGKTSLAVNLALALAKSGRRTCLVDGDLGLANVDVLLNLHPRHSLRDVVTNDMSLEDVVVHGPGGLDVIPAASGVEALANLSAVNRQSLVSRLQQRAVPAGMTILDTGAGLSRTVLALALAADEVAVVTTPEPTALTDAYAMIKVLTQRHPKLPLQLIVNLAEHAAQAREVHGHMDRIVQRFLRREVPLAGWIPRDACVERAVREQRPLMLYFPYARATEAIQELACGLLRRVGPAGRPEFWRRLIESRDDVDRDERQARIEATHER
jgi:flagellar biosynthesis protein FlhG